MGIHRYLWLHVSIFTTDNHVVLFTWSVTHTAIENELEMKN